MGLDQYAYATDSKDSEEQVELAYWRKHNRLQGWMEQLWEDKGRPNFYDAQAMGDFNCVPLEITEDDLDALEEDVCGKKMPQTGGFFFGDDSYSWENENGEEHKGKDYYHKENDLNFIEQAREAIKDGKKVFYNCWY